MIKRIVLSIILFLAFLGPVIAQHHHRHAPQQHRNSGGFGTALGLSLLGLGVAGAYYYNHQLPPTCWKEIVGYDRYGREMWEVTCR